MITPKVGIPVARTAMDRKSVSSDSNRSNQFDMLMNHNVQKNKRASEANKMSSNNKSDVGEKQNVSVDKKDTSTNKPMIEEDAFKGSKDVSSATKTNASNDSEEITVPDEVIETINQLEQLISVNVAKQLGISQEELTAQLETMGMTAIDLLDVNNLKEFVLNMNGSQNPIDFLMNEDLSNQLNGLTKLLEELPENELGLSKQDVTKISSILEQLQQLEKAPLMEETNPAATQMNKQVSDETVTNESQIDVDADEKEIPVTLTKESSSTKEDDSNADGFLKESKDGKEQNSLLTEKNRTPIDTFVQNLSTHKTANLDNLEPILEQTKLMKDIVNQVVEQIKIAIKPDSTSMELQLNPEHLGKISLTVAEKNGEMTASFVAQNHAAKEAIESQIQTLKDNLSNQGLKVEAVEVTVSEFGFKQDTQTGQGADSQGNENSKKSNSRRKIDLSILDDSQETATEEEILAAKVLKDNGGSIDYTA